MAPSRPMWCVPSKFDRFQRLHMYYQYRARDAPWYRPGHGIILAYIAIGWLSSVAFMIYLRLENSRRDRGERDEVIGADGDGAEGDIMKAAKNGMYESIAAARADKGDEWSGFRYTL